MGDLATNPLVGGGHLRLELTLKVALDELARDWSRSLLALLVEPASEGRKPMLVVLECWFLFAAPSHLYRVSVTFFQRSC